MARRPRIPPVIPVRTLVPTILTVMALCAGVTSIRFALAERWEDAVIAIMVAALFDLLDGRVARMLKGASRFGAELDSLSDVICFGVAPALVFYLWSLNTLPGLGWAVVLLFCVCCALRLARFNILDQDASEDGTVQHFFVGVPAPAAAGLLILPMIAWFEVNWSFLQSGYLGAAYAIIIALLMISRLPTLTLKYVRIDRGLVVPVLVAIGVLVGLLAIYFWATMALLGVLYMLSIPFAAVQSRRHTDASGT
ncbi:MAG: CDP-diacylglycerol--serine O-phosphatidyltransferase [Alphaproteobacteria bacterium]